MCLSSSCSSSLRKAVLRTCIGTDKSASKEFPTTTMSTTSLRPGTANTKNSMYGNNGDVFSAKKDLKEKETFAVTDVLPEEIPGLPKHHPMGNFSPRFDSWHQC